MGVLCSIRLVGRGVLAFFLVAQVGCGDAPRVQPPEVFDKHRVMFEAVRTHLNQPDLFLDGQWQKHYGDGAMFGPSFDLAEWRRTGDMKNFERGVAALEHNRKLVEEVADDVLAHLDNIELISMSLLSLIEAGLYLDDASTYQKAATELIDSLDSVAQLMNDYLEIDAGQFAATTYGPTSLSAFLSLMHLEFAFAYPDVDTSHHVTRANEILENVHRQVWDEEMGVYRFARRDRRLMLYPNITMMVSYGRAYQITGEGIYYQRFSEVYRGIQPLKDESGDHYHSPYSAEEMGSKIEDYCTHSSQNYLMMALWLGYQTTGEQRYLNEIDTLLTFVERELHRDGVIVHHWVNKRAALPEDPYYYCLGCNAQTLYILLSIEQGTDGVSGHGER